MSTEVLTHMFEEEGEPTDQRKAVLEALQRKAELDKKHKADNVEFRKVFGWLKDTETYHYLCNLRKQIANDRDWIENEEGEPSWSYVREYFLHGEEWKKAKEQAEYKANAKGLEVLIG
ncbi:MAG: hypothetical protein ABSG17_00655 [Spirochaetia bacterium]